MHTRSLTFDSATNPMINSMHSSTLMSLLKYVSKNNLSIPFLSYGLELNAKVNALLIACGNIGWSLNF